MTPQERQLVAELFERLATLEGARRDPDAERAIAEGLARAPGAPYALVQTVLVQDEALKRADARIRDLEAAGGAQAPREGSGFLDNMRDAIFGQRQDQHADQRGSVPSVRPGNAPMGVPPAFRTDTAPSAWGNAPAGGQPMGGPMMQGSGGGSFLGTAAAAAAGVIGGSLMLDGIRSMFGHHSGAFGQGAFDPGLSGDTASPWVSGSGSDDLARQAGIDDIGRSSSAAFGDSDQRTAGLLDSDDTNDDVDDSADINDAPDLGGNDSDVA
jgi:uncharacterized protein